MTSFHHRVPPTIEFNPTMTSQSPQHLLAQSLCDVIMKPLHFADVISNSTTSDVIIHHFIAIVLNQALCDDVITNFLLPYLSMTSYFPLTTIVNYISRHMATDDVINSLRHLHSFFIITEPNLSK